MLIISHTQSIQSYISHMKTLILIFSLSILIFADQLIPIPKQQYGFSVGDLNGKLHIEAFIDLLCPDSRTSFNALRNVIKTVDLSASRVRLTFQSIPLPMHFYAFKVHQAMMYVQKNSYSNTYKVIQYFFDKQDQFTQQVLIDYTINNFLDQLASLVSSLTKVNEKDLRKELATGSDTDRQTRYHWKYSVGTHGVSGAPIFNANSVRIDGAQNFGYKQWVAFIKQYTS